MTATLTDTIIAATITVLACGLGGLPFVFVSDFPRHIARLGWAISGGLMLSASVFNLIMPGVADAGITPVAIGIFLGAGVMVLASMWLNGRDFHVSGMSDAGARRSILVLATLFIHSFPEGLAVGVAFGSGEVGLGLIMAVAIAIHNIPEGIAVSLPLRAEGVSGWRCVGWATHSGLFSSRRLPAAIALRFWHRRRSHDLVGHQRNVPRERGERKPTPIQRRRRHGRFLGHDDAAERTRLLSCMPEANDGIGSGRRLNTRALLRLFQERKHILLELLTRK
jgi:ZIP family zinc transporter